jgi:Enoyl-(Acyl carrier protein) reductase
LRCRPRPRAGRYRQSCRAQRQLSSRSPCPKLFSSPAASRGIGRACALLAARRGWSVGVNYRADADAADAVVHAIAKEGGRAVALKCDVADEADVVAIFDQATDALGRLTGVIANAGIVAPSARLAEMSAERMRRVFEVNVLGAYLTAREAARRMSESAGGAGGSIVLMSSAAARLGSPNLYVDYAGPKGAIDTLAIGLSRGARSGGREGQCDPPRPRRDGNPCERRRTRPRPAPSDTPPRSGGPRRRRKSPRRRSGF